ncbi:MAG TPA: aspartate aminotransferase family protein [Candidatus Acidoferrales bacterium]|nr:aspartate aminotransferase family protein [Candidatus Acidoferrales bacterium]
MAEVDRSKIATVLDREGRDFVRAHPRSKRMFERARRSMIGGVPMNWMIEWPGAFPIFAARARGSKITDVDGHRYVDFCLGDTGAMFGHGPEATVRAVIRQVPRGITTMLPTEDTVWVGEELTRRFGLPYWQAAMTATDANRFALRMAREATGRRKVLVFNGCYHGTLDEALVRLVDGRVTPREGSMPPPIDPELTTKIIEFNEPTALEQALTPGDVAAVLMEPAMTNCGIILPEPGYLDKVRDVTRHTGTVWIIDETHTWCAGPGGYTQAHGLKPDMITLGKPVAGGIPAAAIGLSQELYDKTAQNMLAETTGVNGLGGTLTGNALALAAMHATLEKVITPKAYRRVIPLAKKFNDDIQRTIRNYGLPWHSIQLGTRVEYRFRGTPPRNGAEAIAAKDPLLNKYVHLYDLNRRILLTPFHNMALISPYTTTKDVNLHTHVFRASVQEILS